MNREIEIKKVIGNTPENLFDAIDMINKRNQEFIDSLHLLILASEYINGNVSEKINSFLNKYTHEAITAG